VTDESTLGGYVAVHTRPPAFMGVDGNSYTVDVAIDESGDPVAPIGGYLLFIRWSGQPPSISGHLESDFVVRGQDAASVLKALDTLSLLEVKSKLDALIQAQ
jgi:hypothetical protein